MTVMALKLMYITNDETIAKIAEKHGVDRIWIDLETLGKEERQKNMNTVKSHHKVLDITKVKNVLSTSEVLVRINPINENSEREIKEIIHAGADMIMLPMWKSKEEVQVFLKLIRSNSKAVKTTLLLETKEAVECIDTILDIGGFDEIHIGLNDLHLSYNLTFMFELLSNGVVEKLCDKFKKAGIPYGFGGIAKIGDGLLPAERIIMEHYRLGSTRAILSRTFCDNAVIESSREIERVFNINMKKMRQFEETLKNFPLEEFMNNKNEVAKIVKNIVKTKGENNAESKL